MKREKFKIASQDADSIIKNGSSDPVAAEEILKFLDYKKYTSSDNKMFLNSLFASYGTLAWDRFVDTALRLSVGDRTPLWVDVAVTGKCHCDCWHCFRSKFEDKSDIPQETLRGLFSDIRDLGTPILGITGGEPMLRKDIAEIFSLVPEEMEIELYTTGYGVDQKFMRETADTPFTRTVISLDHYKPDIVNKSRNRKNAYDEAMEALELMKSSKIYCGVTLCVTEDLCREEELYKYIDFVTLKGADEIRIVLPVPQGKVEGKSHVQLYINARKLLRKLKEDTAEDLNVPNLFIFSDIESFSNIGCGAGTHYFSVNNDGGVTPCVSVPLTFGNIYEKSVKDIFSSMGEYFKMPGNMCYGKKVSKVMKGRVPNGTSYPFDEKLSRELASDAVVDGANAGFFCNLQKLDYRSRNNQPA